MAAQAGPTAESAERERESVQRELLFLLELDTPSAP